MKAINAIVWVDLNGRKQVIKRIIGAIAKSDLNQN